MKRGLFLIFCLLLSSLVYAGTLPVGSSTTLPVTIPRFSIYSGHRQAEINSKSPAFANMSTLQTIGRGGNGGVAVNDIVTKGPWVDVRAYGAIADKQTVTTGSMSSSSAVLTIGSALFSSRDVGKIISVSGAGSAGATLFTTIAGYASSTQVTLTAAASTPVSGATVTWGTNNTPKIQAAATYADTKGGTVYSPVGNYLLGDSGNAELIKIQNPTTRFVGGGFLTQFYIMGNVSNTTDVLHFIPSVDQPDFYSKGLTFADFSIYPESGTPGRHGILIDTTDSHLGGLGNMLIKHVNIQHQLNYANNTASAPGYAVVLQNSSGNNSGTFASSIVDSFLRGGVYLNRGGDSLVIARNNIRGPNDGVLVNLIPGSAQLVIEKNNMSSNGAEVRITSGLQVQIRYNQMEHPFTDGSVNHAIIDLDGTTSGAVTECAIENNNINPTGNMSYGIRIAASTRPMFKGNTVALGTSNYAYTITNAAIMPIIKDNLSGLDLLGYIGPGESGIDTVIEWDNLGSHYRYLKLGGTPTNPIGTMEVYSGKSLTNATVNLVDVQLLPGQWASGTIYWTIQATNSTDIQVYSGQTNYAVRYNIGGGSYSGQVTQVTSLDNLFATSGTITTSWGYVTGANKITIQITPTTSLTGTSSSTYTISYHILQGALRRIIVD